MYSKSGRVYDAVLSLTYKYQELDYEPFLERASQLLPKSFYCNFSYQFVCSASRYSVFVLVIIFKVKKPLQWGLIMNMNGSTFSAVEEIQCTH